MTKEHATWEAERISKFYGSAVLFREPSRRESYQAAVDGPPEKPGYTIIACFKNGVEVA